MKESLQGPSWPHQEKKKRKAALLDSIALPSPEGRPGCPLTERTRCTLVINLSMRDESDKTGNNSAEHIRKWQFRVELASRKTTWA